jgi:hypothetical protein
MTNKRESYRHHNGSSSSFKLGSAKAGAFGERGLFRHLSLLFIRFKDSKFNIKDFIVPNDKK